MRKNILLSKIVAFGPLIVIGLHWLVLGSHAIGEQRQQCQPVVVAWGPVVQCSPSSDPESTGPDQQLPSFPGIIDFPNNSFHFDSLVAPSPEEAPFYPSRALTSGNLTKGDFEDSQVCGACHTEIYEQWKSSIMAHAWDDPIYRALLKKASIATGGKVDKLCIGCHSPIGLTTGSADAVIATVPEDPGVDCETCHNISGSTGLGNGSYILSPRLYGRPLRFGPRKDAQSPIHDTAYSDLHTKSEFCAVCHNVTHPFNNLPVERTYDEWRDSPYNSAGIECQDCHMTPGPGVTENPGKSAPMGKERSHIFSHEFIGANVTLHNYYGDFDAAKKATAMLQSAATIEMLDPPTKASAGETLELTLRVTNVGAGHKLPTGFPEGREMWIDLQVHDATGREIYRLGKVEDGKTEPGTHSFKAVLANKDSEIVHIEVWEAAQILTDNRILPKGYSDELFRIPLPADTQSPITVTADLLYWSFPPALLEKILEEETIKVEITNMANLSREISVLSVPQ